MASALRYFWQSVCANLITPGIRPTMLKSSLLSMRMMGVKGRQHQSSRACKHTGSHKETLLTLRPLLLSPSFFEHDVTNMAQAMCTFRSFPRIDSGLTVSSHVWPPVLPHHEKEGGPNLHIASTPTPSTPRYAQHLLRPRPCPVRRS